MGTNTGNGTGGQGGNEMAGGMPSNGPNQPLATEYTLQGVMRFLQTEWHRHERDRNAWEIEKQEMKGRIAALEGQARRSDATQNALKKYVAILERKVKEQSAQLKAAASGEATEPQAVKPPNKPDRAALLAEKLKSSDNPPVSAEMEGIELERADDEAQRSELKNFLDQCQAEFTYLMITPANPLPPRESPPLPSLDDLRGDLMGIPEGQQRLDQPFAQMAAPQQNHVREQSSRNAPMANHQPHQPVQAMQSSNFLVRNPDVQAAPMARSAPEQQTGLANTTDWPAPMTAGSQLPDEQPRPNHVMEQFEQAPPNDELSDRQRSVEGEGWDFGEGTFPDPVTTQQQQAQHQQHPSGRPDTDAFPTAENLPKSPNRAPQSHRRKTSMSRRKSADHELSLNAAAQKSEGSTFKPRYVLRGHLDTVRAVIFSGGGSPSEPEICTAGDDGMIKRFHLPSRPPSHSNAADVDVTSDFTHRGHAGAVLCITSWSPSPNFSTGGRAQGDGWIFSGGQDASLRVWERGRVDPKATLDGHTDAVWALCVLPATLGGVFGQSNQYGPADRILVVSGAADGTVIVWAVSAPPQLTSPQPGSSRRGPGGRVRGNSMSSGSQFPNSPQPTIASNSPFHHNLIHQIHRSGGSKASPTCITPLSSTGESFVVSYSDAAIIVYDTRTGEEIGSMASSETYDGSINTSVNAVVSTTVGLDQHPAGSGSFGDDDSTGGPTGGGRAMAGSGVEGVIISGHEDRYVRFFDANSGQCTYNMVAHPASISALSLSPDGRELVSAGHDASLRFWSLEKRSCTQEISAHRVQRGEGACSVVWSQDGRWVVSGGGDGMVKVFAR